MKAVILVGGEGTRLRPLTFSLPKPMIPVINKPFLLHMIDWLKRHGISEIILSMGYLSTAIEDYFGDGSRFGVKMWYVVEDSPLGTGGAIKNVERFVDDTFIVLNGDILTDLDLTSMIAFHREHKAVATISLTPVEDPSAYGLVDLDDRSRVLRFLEKPSPEEITTNLINAGTYIMESSVLDIIPPNRNVSVEREVYPGLLERGNPVYGYPSGAYWLDIGTPAKYLMVNRDLLMGTITEELPNSRGERIWLGEGTKVSPRARLVGPVLTGANCVIEDQAYLSGPVVLGNNCRIGPETWVQDSVLWDDCSIGARSHIRHSILASAVEIGENVIVADETVIGERCVIGSTNRLKEGIRIWPGKTIEPNTISF